MEEGKTRQEGRKVRSKNEWKERRKYGREKGDKEKKEGN